MSRTLLFTPGPLNTSERVKRAMLRDLGSRDAEFLRIIEEIRGELLALGEVSKEAGYEAILLQGSGTYAVEAAITSLISPTGKLLVLVNGAYGERMAQIAIRNEVRHEILRWPENRPYSIEEMNARLNSDHSITHVAAVHCETSTGMLNPVEEIGRAVQACGRTFILDAMSSFGAIPISLARAGVDFLISSANKCIQGVPGFAFVLAQRAKLEASAGIARPLSLDLYDQWAAMEKSGQFRFTPPTHALLAFREALRELHEEGGIAARGARYAANHKLLNEELKRLGFVAFLPSSTQSPIITAFYYPNHPKFDFEEFYRRLALRSMVIYPGKLTRAKCFRLGNIGDLHSADIGSLVRAMEAVLVEMEIPVPVPAPEFC